LIKLSSRHEAGGRMAGVLPRRLAAAVWLLAVVVAASSGGGDAPAVDDAGAEVVLMLDEEEGVAYARVMRAEGSAGWMELWQEGHRLMANTTEPVHGSPCMAVTLSESGSTLPVLA